MDDRRAELLAAPLLLLVHFRYPVLVVCSALLAAVRVVTAAGAEGAGALALFAAVYCAAAIVATLLLVLGFEVLDR